MLAQAIVVNGPDRVVVKLNRAASPRDRVFLLLALAGASALAVALVAWLLRPVISAWMAVALWCFFMVFAVYAVTVEATFVATPSAGAFVEYRGPIGTGRARFAVCPPGEALALKIRESVDVESDVRPYTLFEVHAETAKGQIFLCSVATREQAASLADSLAQILGCQRPTAVSNPSLSGLVTRPVRAADAPAWARLRQALWPSDTNEHEEEIAQFFEGPENPALTTIVAEREGEILGFAEVSLRAYAEGCSSSPVGYLEGWYVVPEARRQGVGRALVRAAELWAKEQGCTEFASDTELENTRSAAAHRALGFEEVEIIRCFRKPLSE